MAVQSSNKRLFKNTILLYVRMIVLLVISLYTSRIVLASLGVDDFGIYNVVGGIVVIMSFLNNSMASSTQRFLNVELGRNDFAQLKAVFNTSRVIHFIIAGIVWILAETLGVWFLNTFMNIASDRIVAANWVFQFSILTFMTNIVSVPYNAVIIAHEKMSVFAYITIIEAIMKLAIVYLLWLTTFDKLIVYAALMLLVAITVRMFYIIYCCKHFDECKYKNLRTDKMVMRKMLGFSGWTIFGALGSISHTQGISIVMNMFFGVGVNAAQGIANQVTNVVNQFVANFMTAINPQIVKTYAAGQLDEMHILIRRGSRMGICLVAFFAIPLILETPAILNLWLTVVPDYTVTFIRIILLTTMCNAYAQPLATAKSATGIIKNYQIILTTLGWLHVPLAWLCFKIGKEPYYAMYVYFILINIMQVIRIYMVCKSIKMSIQKYVKDVNCRCAIMVFVASIIPFVSHTYLPHSIICSLITIIIGFASVTVSIYLIGITKHERCMINLFIKNKIKH